LSIDLNASPLSSALIGTRQRRIDGAAKVTGSARFAADLAFPGMLHARLVLSPVAAATILHADVAAAYRVPGVVTVILGSDLAVAPGPDAPLASGHVYYAGQPVAAVVADSEAAAADAAHLIDVHYEELPAVLDPIGAIERDAPAVLGDGPVGFDDSAAHGAPAAATGDGVDHPANVTFRSELKAGNVDEALSAAAVVVRGTYYIPAVHQGFLEPHVAVAAVEPDGQVSIWTPTQGAFTTRSAVAAALGLAVSDVRIVPTEVGGGFGGKVILIEPLVALLAKHVKRPVRLVLTRSEEFLMGRHAQGFEIELEVGAGDNGKLSGLRARVLCDNGAGRGGIGRLAAATLAGTYRIDDYAIETLEVATNRAPVSAYRAPGATQAAFALECALDEISERLRIAPIELRILNAPTEGDPRPGGARWPRIGYLECLREAATHPIYTAPIAQHEAVGVAGGAWIGGLEPAAAACRVDSDGTALVHVGSSDITGTHTSMAMLVAEELSVRLDQVRIVQTDTVSAPYAGMAGGSKILYTVGLAVQLAAQDARRQLIEIATEELEADANDLELVDGMVRVRGVPARGRSIGELAGLATQFGGRYCPVLGQGRSAQRSPSPMFTVQIARVRTDPETGLWEITGFAAIQDVGRAINPAEIEGQIHGGALQAMGRALGEEMVWDGAGQLVTATFADYALPSIDQAPVVDVTLLEIPSASGPLGAKGVGEPPAIPGAAAVANAVSRASGRRVRSLPIDPAGTSVFGATRLANASPR
jgi:CO/xanthine dehydrogenase Mo-binding subunit